MAKDKSNRARSRRRKRGYSLSKVPNEIVNHVLGFLPTASLVNLCLVSKSLCRSAEPLLYSTIILKWTMERAPPIIELLQALLKRPELLAYIDTLSLQGLRGLIPVVQKFNISFADLWVQKLRAGTMDAYAGLLIAQLSNVSRLAVVDNFLCSPDFLAQIIQAKALGQLPKFERLEHMIFFAPTSNQTPEVAIAPFYLPMITQLVVSARDIEALAWPAGDLSHLTSLAINSHCAGLMAGLLSRTWNLKSLSWEWEYYSEAINVNYDDIMGALSHVKSTLETLHLRQELLHYFQGYEEPTLTISGFLGALADFDKITDLEVPLVALAGLGPEVQPLATCLPRNIQHLSLTSGMIYQQAEWLPHLEDEWLDESVVEVIEDFVITYTTRPPRLRSIKVIDNADCFRTQQIDKLLEESPLFDDVEIEVVRNTSSPWRHNLDGM
ncbi:unnamed protein product [Clonostachys rosea f. rosea IK726]|uniref:Uncharacterized protein n=1 Tax=Clonostachys rosea f. rosea IK726 TaxID=1349383 RepID=A0ACA9USM4_BIOOC|nr:unnamed protein product [Clonostachys rosea f. rosea IK726]